MISLRRLPVVALALVLVLAALVLNEAKLTAALLADQEGAEPVPAPAPATRAAHLSGSSAIEATAAAAAAIKESTAIEFAELEANKLAERRRQARFAQQPQQQEATALRSEATTTSGHKNRKIFTNQFVIEVRGGENEARRLADKHGFIYLNHIMGDFYHLEHRRLARRSTTATLEAANLNVSIEEEPQVLKLERQVLKRRVKRDFLALQQPQPHPQAQSQPASGGGLQRPSQHFTRPPNQPPATSGWLASTAAGQRRPSAVRMQSGGFLAHLHSNPMQQKQSGILNGDILMEPSGPAPFFLQPNSAPMNQSANNNNNNNNVQHLFQAPNSFQRQPPAPSSSPFLANNNNNNSIQLDRMGHSLLFGSGLNHSNSQKAPFNDPIWPLMWYLDGGARDGFDLNVQAAWRMGYTGKGIVITILDDGLEKDHPDLQANYDPLASFDINGDDADPMPRYDSLDSNRHGTRCAGEVAAVPDNNICSIGIAYNAKVGGVRMLDGDVTDAVEARSLSLNNQHIHIYSASWGPDDNGKTVDGPGWLATRAFMNGVTNGRQGLGSIFVFASGNGGREHDNCNCDGYTNSIWTLSISSATENGYVPWYIEACSSTLATTYSSGAYDERQIATTDIRHSCTSNHTGTSASAPIAAAICALVLESNPRLTWRDMQHIVVRTAKPANLIAKDWRTNGLGRNVSHAFGYGLMDAAAMISMAKRWTTVPVQYTCEVQSPNMEKVIPAKGYIELKLGAECANVRFLEHVQSKVTLSAGRRGDLHIYLVSPHGTRSTLLAQRPNDSAEQGFKGWPFMTVHNWGESPNGVWTLEVHNDGKPTNQAILKEWTLILYGTSEDPNKHLVASESNLHNNRHKMPDKTHQTGGARPFSGTQTGQPQEHSTVHLQATQTLAPLAPSPPPPPPPAFAPAPDSNSDLVLPKLSSIPNHHSSNDTINSLRKPITQQTQTTASTSTMSSASNQPYVQSVVGQTLHSLPPPPLKQPPTSTSSPPVAHPIGQQTLAPIGPISSTMSTNSISATTTSSYISSYKTVMGDQENGRDSTNNNTQTHSDKQTTQSLNDHQSHPIGNQQAPASGSSVHIGRLHDGPMIKPDFDVVAAPQQQQQNGASNHWSQSSTVATNTPPQVNFKLALAKYGPVNRLENFKDERGESTADQSLHINGQQNKSLTNGQQKPAQNSDEPIDNNELDSKLSKDYRSSGSVQKDSQQLDQQIQQNSASNCHSFKLNNLLLLLQQVLAISGLLLVASKV